MGQKVHPYGFRLGVNKPWRSRWFVERDYDKLLIEDVHLREELKEKLKAAGYEFGASILDVIHCPSCPKGATPDPDDAALKAVGLEE